MASEAARHARPLVHLHISEVLHGPLNTFGIHEGDNPGRRLQSKGFFDSSIRGVPRESTRGHAGSARGLDESAKLGAPLAISILYAFMHLRFWFNHRTRMRERPKHAGAAPSLGTRRWAS